MEGAERFAWQQLSLLVQTGKADLVLSALGQSCRCSCRLAVWPSWVAGFPSVLVSRLVAFCQLCVVACDLRVCAVLVALVLGLSCSGGRLVPCWVLLGFGSLLCRTDGAPCLFALPLGLLPVPSCFPPASPLEPCLVVALSLCCRCLCCCVVVVVVVRPSPLLASVALAAASYLHCNASGSIIAPRTFRQSTTETFCITAQVEPDLLGALVCSS